MKNKPSLSCIQTVPIPKLVHCDLQRVGIVFVSVAVGRAPPQPLYPVCVKRKFAETAKARFCTKQ